MMTVDALIHLLQSTPGHLQVILATDEEGNHFNPVHSVEVGIQRPGAEEEMDFGTAAMWEADPSEVNAVCVWPR